jgi:cobalt-zinc-cadmium efflux system outer membrane protein
LAAESSLAAGQELVRISEASATASRKRVDSGDTPYQEQLRAEIQYDQAKNLLAQLNVQVQVARQSLITLLGRPDLLDVPISGTLTASCQPHLLTSPAEDWLERHPSHHLAATQLQLARLEADQARLTPYPDVTAGVAGGRLGETDASIVEFGLSIPLPLLDSAKGRKAEANAGIRVARSELEAVRLELLRQWRQALNRYRMAGDQVTAYRTSILPKAAEALRLVQTGFQEGKFGFIDLLDTQRTFAQSQLDYQQRLLELNIAEAELEALVNPPTRPDR